jgi:hypothetical protein
MSTGEVIALLGCALFTLGASMTLFRYSRPRAVLYWVLGLAGVLIAATGAALDQVR